MIDYFFNPSCQRTDGQTLLVPELGSKQLVVSVFEPQVVPDLGSELLIVSIFETSACTVCTSGALVPELGSKLLQYISCFSS